MNKKTKINNFSQISIRELVSVTSICRSDLECPTQLKDLIPFGNSLVWRYLAGWLADAS